MAEGQEFDKSRMNGENSASDALNAQKSTVKGPSLDSGGETSNGEQTTQIRTVLSSTAEGIMTYIGSNKSTEDEDVQDPESRINQDITRAYTNKVLTTYARAGYHVASVNPNEYDTLDAFRDAIQTELRNRRSEQRAWEVFGGLFAEVTSPDDLVKLIGVYEKLRLQTKDKKNELITGKLVEKIVDGAIKIVEDPEEGEANIVNAANAAFPALRALTQQQRAATGDIGQGFANEVSKALTHKSDRGTAERNTALYIRKYLHELGYPINPDILDIAPSERYLTQETLARIQESEGDNFVGLPEGPQILEAVQKLILDTVVKKASEGDPIAIQIKNAFGTLRDKSRTSGVYRQQARSLIAPLTIANALTPELNGRENLTGIHELLPLNERDLSEMPAAFHRILLAISPDLLREATVGPVKDGTPLRHRMIYINALTTQWNDFQNILYGPTVADYILELQAKGWDDATIAAHIEDLESSRGDRTPTERYQRIREDPRTRKKRVYWERRKPGHGVLS